MSWMAKVAALCIHVASNGLFCMFDEGERFALVISTTFHCLTFYRLMDFMSTILHIMWGLGTVLEGAKEGTGCWRRHKHKGEMVFFVMKELVHGLGIWDTSASVVPKWGLKNSET